LALCLIGSDVGKLSGTAKQRKHYRLMSHPSAKYGKRRTKPKKPKKKPRKQKSILWIGSILLCFVLTGCNELASATKWPIYREPPAAEFKADEKLFLTKFAAEHPELFKKVQGQYLSYRAIVRTHNKHAKKHNLKVMETLGYDKEDLKQLLED